MAKRLAIIILVSVVRGGCGQRYEPAVVPPVLTYLEYRTGWNMPPTANGVQLVIEGTRHYNKSVVEPPNCNQSQEIAEAFVLDNVVGQDPADEYIDVTIVLRDGVAPGAQNGRAFLLEHTGPASGQTWVLMMRQTAAPPDEYLRKATWRLRTNGSGDANTEIGNGNVAMPPAGAIPWTRAYPKNDPFGGTWRVTNTSNLNQPFAATIDFRAYTQAVVCPGTAGPPR